MASMNIFPKAICIIGGDGTGKTAHAKEIINEILQKGKKCSYAWFGEPYFFSYPFMFICNRLGYTVNHKLTNGIECQEHQYYRNKALALIWPWIQLADLLIIVLLKVYVPVWQHKIVVCDRFVHDTLVEVMTDINDKKLINKTVGKLFLSLKPSFAFVVRLDASSQTAYSRKTDVPKISFLSLRKENYDNVAKEMKIPTINTESAFELVHQSIMKRVSQQ